VNTDEVSASGLDAMKKEQERKKKEAKIAAANDAATKIFGMQCKSCSSLKSELMQSQGELRQSQES